MLKQIITAAAIAGTGMFANTALGQVTIDAPELEFDVTGLVPGSIQSASFNVTALLDDPSSPVETAGYSVGVNIDNDALVVITDAQELDDPIQILRGSGGFVDQNDPAVADPDSSDFLFLNAPVSGATDTIDDNDVFGVILFDYVVPSVTTTVNISFADLGGSTLIVATDFSSSLLTGASTGSLTFTVVPVPEPGLAMAGLAGMGFLVRRRRA